MKHLHKLLAGHHERMAKLHGGHADGLEDDDVHKGLHRQVAGEHAMMAKFHKAAADGHEANLLPEPSEFPAVGADRYPKAAGGKPNFELADAFASLGVKPFAGRAWEPTDLDLLDPDLRKLVATD